MNVSHLANQFRLDYQISHMPLDFDQLVDVLRRHFRILRYSEAQEEEANEFALNVRAPVCYLAKLRVRSPEDIRAVAGVSEEDAQRLYERVLKYRKEDHLVTRREKDLVKMMSGAGERPTFHPGEKRLKQVAAAAFIALALILGICCCAPYFSDEEERPDLSYSSGENYGGSVPRASAKEGPEAPPVDSEPAPDERALSSQQEPPAGQKTETFWVTRYGECYHREDCFHLYGKDNLREMTRQDARDEGLRPCTDCRPDDESNENPLEVYSGGFVCIFRF